MSKQFIITTTFFSIWSSLVVVMQAQEESMFSALMLGSKGPVRGFGCLACRYVVQEVVSFWEYSTYRTCLESFRENKLGLSCTKLKTS